MGWRFRKSFKVFPGVRLNIGKKGITSATFGKGWFSTNVSKRGVYQNFNVPGTGISYRSKVETANSHYGEMQTVSASTFPVGAIAFVMTFVGSLFLGSIIVSITKTPNTPAASPPTAPYADSTTTQVKPVTPPVTKSETTRKYGATAGRSLVVIAENANLRETANQTGEIIQTLPSGALLEMLKQKGPWFMVGYGRVRGWVHGNTVQFNDGISKDDTAIPSSAYSYSPPSYSSPSTGSSYDSYGSKNVHVKGYYRKNGTYVSPHYRRSGRR